MAANFACMRSNTDTGFPVILAARLADVLRSGTPVPDLLTWICTFDSDPAWKPVGWRDSLERLNAIAVLDGRHVPNLLLHCITDERPDAAVYLAKLRAWIR